MKIKYTYIAEDGNQFDNEMDCIEYEWTCNHPHIKEIEFYDKDDCPLLNAPFDYIAEVAEKVIVKSSEALKDLYAFADFTGILDYEDIKCPGCWIWTNSFKGFVCQESYE